MARYFFDIDDGQLHRDTEGTECANLEEVRKEAMNALPEIARYAIPTDGDQQAFAVFARDERRNLIYKATLTYAGLWADKTTTE